MTPPPFPICPLHLTTDMVPQTPGGFPLQLPLRPVCVWVQCPGDGVSLRGAGAKLSTVCLSPVRQLLEIQAQYHRQSLGSLDSALAELKESHSKTGTHWLSVQPGEGCSRARGMQVWPARLGKASFPSLHLLLPPTSGWWDGDRSLRQAGDAARPASACAQPGSARSKMARCRMALAAAIPPDIHLPLPEPTFTADTPVAGYYGVPLETHLKSLGREIALPIEACVMMLLASGMREEVGSTPEPPRHPLPPNAASPRPFPLLPTPRDFFGWQRVPQC